MPTMCRRAQQVAGWFRLPYYTYDSSINRFVGVIYDDPEPRYPGCQPGCWRTAAELVEAAEKMGIFTEKREKAVMELFPPLHTPAFSCSEQDQVGFDSAHTAVL